MAASLLCRSLLDGPRTRLASAHRGRESWLLTGPDQLQWVCVSTPRAVRLPRALVVGRLPLDSTSIGVGGGFLWYGERPVAVRRWFVPPRVASGSLAAYAGRASAIREWLTTWADQIGEGDGLTPYADDVTCGVLLGLRAIGDPRAELLGQQVRDLDLQARTTTLSAALLRSAAEGWCIPQVAAVVTALAKGRGIAHAVGRLLDVGHSSGRGLWVGLSTVLEPPAGVEAA